MSADVIRNIFWQPLRIADHDKANEALDALVAELEEAVAALREVKQASLEREIELVAEKEKLREALTYYAEGRYPDSGEIAREALSRVASRSSRD